MDSLQVRGETQQGTTSKKKAVPPAPDNLDYWISKLDWEQCANELEKQAIFGPVSADEFHGTIEDIQADLRKHAVWDDKYLDRISAELVDLEILLQQYNQLYFGVQPKRTDLSESEGLRQLPKMLLRELEERQDALISSMLEHERRLKTLDRDQVYNPSGCRSVLNEQPPTDMEGTRLPALPNQVDGVFVVDKISRTEQEPVQRVWRKGCYSRGTLKMLQGTFWWFWTEKFQMNKKLQADIFDVLSETFVQMIIQLSLEDSDKFVLHYPRCLAQAVYCVFIEAYPLSVKLFNSEFRRDLANLTSTWITGNRVAQDSWNRWPLLSILPILSASEVDVEQKEATKQFADAQSALQRMQKEFDEGHVRFEGDAEEHHESPSKHPKYIRDVDEDSYEVGVVQVNRIRVGVFSLSPLVKRLLVLHQLKEEDHFVGVGLRRTEITALPGTRGPSYQEVSEYKEVKREERYAQYHQKLETLNKGLNALLKEHIRALRQFERKNKETLSRKFEVKMISERLVEQLKNTHPSFNKDRYLPKEKADD